MPTPTERQTAFLENRGIIVPPTKAVASTLIGYVKEGNGVGIARTEAERIVALITIQQHFIGKRVRDKLSPREGKALYVLAKSKDEVRHRLREEDREEISPFKIYVQWDPGHRGSIVTSGNLDLLE